MAVKYVKDFAFDSGFGYTGSAGQTPVRGYNRGGKVFDNSTRNPISKFPDLAPAMVGKGPGKMGGKTSDVAPMSTAKANPQIAKYAKGGAVKKPMAKPAKNKMNRPMKKADGGSVDYWFETLSKSNPGVDPTRIRQAAEDRVMRMGGNVPQPAVSPLQSMAETATVGPSSIIPEEYDRPLPTPYSEPISEFGRPVNELINVRGEMPTTEEILYESPAPGYKGPSGESSPVTPVWKKLGMTQSEYERQALPPQADLVQKPIDYSDMPMGVMGGGEEYWRKGGIKDQQAEATRRWRESKGLPPITPLPTDDVPVKRPGGPIPGQGQFGPIKTPSPLARAAAPTKTDRMEMRRDKMAQARDIMDQYIAGSQRALPSPRRRAMPVAPRRPMIDRSQPQPMMTRNPGEMPMYGKGGKVTKGERKIGKVMGEFKRGELHSGSKKGPVVTNPKQAKAIALSEARAAGAKISKKAMGGKACG